MRANGATYEVREREQERAGAWRSAWCGNGCGCGRVLGALAARVLGALLARVFVARVVLGALVVRVLLGALVARVFIARIARAARVVLGARVVLVARGALVQKRRQRFCNKNAYEYQHKACYQARRQNVNAQQHANEGCKNRL